MLPTACFNLKCQVCLGIQALSLHPCQCSSMPISIRAHSIPHFHHPLLCACVCRTVGLIRPPHLHEGQTDSTAARLRKQSGWDRMSAHLSSPCNLALSTEVKGALRTEVQTPFMTNIPVSQCTRQLPWPTDPCEWA